MIAHLYGEVASTGDRWVVIDIGGVGYQVQVTQPTLQELKGSEGPVRVYTHMAVREDGVSLYGFTRPSDLELFKILIGVSGIGPQSAIGILSQISFEEFALAVLNDEEKVLTRISGVGPKSAKRLILELKEKMKKRAGTISGGKRLSEADDAVSALVSLGFEPREAQKAIDAVLPGIPDPTVQALIRAALARLREH